jgi:NAD(P)-dependent dehydrogenase (short-subunit alcohol dehydrogenase family)
MPAMSRSVDMTGRTVLITGASQGIGAATALAFAEAGATVVLMARQADRLADLAGRIGPRAHAAPGDVAVWADVAAAVALAVKSTGRLDVLVNNAATIAPIAPLSSGDPAQWARAIEVNLTGVYFGFRAALPVMRAQGSGTILTVSSGAAHHPLDGWSAYCASKAGVAMLTQVADLEERAQGIRIMGLSPGTVDTDMQGAIRASGIGAIARLDRSAHIPPDWPARALVWMCGPEADPHVGQELSLRDEGLRRRIGLI